MADPLPAEKHDEILDWIGIVGRDLVRSLVREHEGEVPLALEDFDREILYAILEKVLQDEELAGQIYFLIPRRLNDLPNNLPEDIWYDGDVAGARNESLPEGKKVMITALDEFSTAGDTVRLVEKINIESFSQNEDYWFGVMNDNGLSDAAGPIADESGFLKKAVAGFLKSKSRNLKQTAKYLRRVRDLIRGGEKHLEALGEALDVLDVPRDKNCFKGFESKEPKQWADAFIQIKTDRAGLPNGALGDKALFKGDLLDNLERLRADGRFASRPDLEGVFALAASDPSNPDNMKPLLLLDWQNDLLEEFLCSKAKKKKATSLAEDTRTVLRENLPVLAENEQNEIDAYLDGLQVREKQANGLESDADFGFFQKYWLAITQSDSLRKKWEKFIYPDEESCKDFAAGLLKVAASLFHDGVASDGQKKRRLVVEFKSKQFKRFSEKVNPWMMRYFNVVYQDLRSKLDGLVVWKTNFGKDGDPLLNWNDWVEKNSIDAVSKSKDANSILQFVVYAVDEKGEAEKDALKIALTWRFDADSFARYLHDDLKWVQENPLRVWSYVANNAQTGMGTIHSVSLLKRTSLRPARIGLNAVLEASPDLEALIEEGLLHEPDEEKRNVFLKAFGDFKTEYVSALTSLRNQGFDSATSVKVGRAYLELLRLASELEDSEQIRCRLVAPLMMIGTIRSVSDDSVHEIVPPWHPLRYGEICRQHDRVVYALRCLIEGDRSLLVGEEYLDLMGLLAERPALPPVLLSYEKDPVSGGVMSLPIEHNLWYTLCENTNVSSQNRSRGKGEHTERAVDELWTALLSYEKLDNLANVRIRMLAVNADEPDMVKLTHQRYGKWSKDEDRSPLEFTLQSAEKGVPALLYNTLTAASVNDDDPSDRTMSSFRTRVTDETLEEIQKDSDWDPSVRPYHLALMHKLAMKESSVEWCEMPAPVVVPEAEYFPQIVDRRKYEFKEHSLSEVFLVSPLLTETTALYLRHAYRVCKSARALYAYDPKRIYLPVRQVRVDSASGNRIGQMLQKAHELADWVVAFDSMLTRRQVLGGQKLIIRYKRSTENMPGSIISSSSSADMLKTKLRDRLGELGGVLVRPNVEDVCDRLFDEALNISGYLGLRAAKQDEAAGELLGLCLSKKIVSDAFEEECARLGEDKRLMSFLMLDDYASWFRKKSASNKIADILAMGLTRSKSDDRLNLHLVLTECKYCAETNEAEESCNQLKNSLKRFEEALGRRLGGPTDSMALRVWFNRFANMLLDSDIQYEGSEEDFLRDLTDLRSGNVRLSINGYSHYFAYQLPSASPITKRFDVGEISAYQEIFGPDEIRDLLEALTVNGNSRAVLEEKMAGVAEKYAYKTFETMRIRDSGEVVASSESGAAEGSTQNPSVTDQFASTPVQTTDERREAAKAADSEAAPEAAEASGMQFAYGPHVSSLIASRWKPMNYSEERIRWADAAAENLRLGFAENSITVREIKHVPTPNGCLVIFQGAANLGQKVVANLSEILLMTRGLELGFTEAAKGEFRIFIKSEERETVPLWNLWHDRMASRNADGTNTSLCIALKELDGGILYLDPNSMYNDPHTLVAGGTGSGKSVLMKSLLLDIAVTNRPDQTRIRIIDPKKGVDYGVLRQLPHIDGPIVDEPEDAIAVFAEVTAEMERRYKLFAESEAENLIDYNTMHPESMLPVIWLFHDELANMVVTDKSYLDEVSGYMKSLATKARAAGIYLVFITQRPDKDVMPMQVRDNLGNRLALKLPTEASSKIALGVSGAEFLAGHGHLAAKIGNHVVYAQCPFLSKEEIAEVVTAVRRDAGLGPA